MNKIKGSRQVSWHLSSETQIRFRVPRAYSVSDVALSRSCPLIHSSPAGDTYPIFRLRKLRPKEIWTVSGRASYGDVAFRAQTVAVPHRRQLRPPGSAAAPTPGGQAASCHVTTVLHVQTGVTTGGDTPVLALLCQKPSGVNIESSRERRFRAQGGCACPGGPPRLGGQQARAGEAPERVSHSPWGTRVLLGHALPLASDNWGRSSRELLVWGHDPPAGPAASGRGVYTHDSKRNPSFLCNSDQICRKGSAKILPTRAETLERSLS